MLTHPRVAQRDGAGREARRRPRRGRRRDRARAAGRGRARCISCFRSPPRESDPKADVNARPRPDRGQAGRQLRLLAASAGLDRGDRRAARAHVSWCRAAGRSPTRCATRSRRWVSTTAPRTAWRCSPWSNTDARWRAWPQRLALADSRAAIGRALRRERKCRSGCRRAWCWPPGHPGVLGGHIRQSGGLARRQSSARAGCCWSSRSSAGGRGAASSTRWIAAASSIRRSRRFLAGASAAAAVLRRRHDHAAAGAAASREGEPAETLIDAVRCTPGTIQVF